MRDAARSGDPGKFTITLADDPRVKVSRRLATAGRASKRCQTPALRNAMRSQLSLHLRQLEAESIAIIREGAAEFRNPVLLYSIGKDSSVLLHIARKAFYPAKLPFPLLHVDTTWKFREMIAFRDRTVRELGLELIVHVN